MTKPNKKNTKELFSLIEKKITDGDYLFVSHAKERLSQRKVLDTDVINILLGKAGRKRKHIPKRDRYEDIAFNQPAEDWKYCIEGKDIDDEDIRIILTFDGNQMPILTVIRI